MFDDDIYDVDNVYIQYSGIPKTMNGIYLHMIKPENEEQETLIKLLNDLYKKKYCTLLLFGNTGVGKTYMAQALANSMIHFANNPERVARYITHLDLDLKLRATMANNGPSEYQVIADYRGCNLLIIDEFGRGPTTNYTMTRVEHILSDRMMNQKRTVLITNKTIEELRNIFDRQMQDRLGIMDGGSYDISKTRCYGMFGNSLRGRL